MLQQSRQWQSFESLPPRNPAEELVGGLVSLQEAAEIGTGFMSLEVRAARIAIEAAFIEGQHGKQGRARYWLSVARTSLEPLQEKPIDPDFSNIVAVTTAKALASQLPLYSTLSIKQQLPDSTMAQQNYSQLVAIGYDFRKAIAGKRLGAYTTDIYGLQAELAALELGQRFAVKSALCNEWFPLLASYSSDTCMNRANDTVNKAWDINVFTADGFGPPTIAYRVQVKSNDKQEKRSKDAPGISRICVEPHLEVHENEPVIAGKILTSCYLEEARENANLAQISETLDKRVDSYLERLDDTSNQI